MGHSYLQPLAALVVVVAVVAATSTAVPVAATATATANKYSGRMVIISAPGASRVVDVSAAGALITKWQQRQRVLVEDQVAPELGTLLGAGYDGYASNDALNKDRAICLPHGQCAAHGQGGSNTRPCTFKDYCPHTTTAAGHARAAVHW